ncbi:helix-turn-helix domain-containing protein [Kitasatospora phosalacinea]|uniref:helix-turn-helix domain-containing protein n=1 Tax=Kitasatospora phosalacinea TaxID=2065 RepID=UPI00068A5D75|nr:Scr1 family TA system antitoxin-like transcriptional regulator [Kitasatospora phosalacinea]
MERRKGTHGSAFCSPDFFASELVRARERAGLSQGDLANLAHCDRSLISRIEAAERVPQQDFVRACDKLLDADGLLLRIWERVPWRQGVEYPDWFRRFAEMEARATMLRDYQVSRVTGLLQTPEYARALLAQGDAAGDEQLIDERVAARMDRQRRFFELDEDGPLLIVVLHEAAIRTVVGGPAVMARQLERLLEVARHPNILLQIAPFDMGEHTPSSVSLTLVTLPGGQECVYSQSLNRGHFISDNAEITRLARRYDRLRANALSAPDSARLIRSIMEGLLNMLPQLDLASASWSKSSYSDENGGQCVEASHTFATTAGIVPVRDSKDPEGPALLFPTTTWQTFLTGLKSGDITT